MPLIGVTGGVATGKSTVTALLREHGAVTFSADEASREVLTVGSPGYLRVLEAFGSGILAPDGSVDRAALGRIVFADPARRLELERITHPLILQRLRQQADDAVARYGPDVCVVIEAPLLFEAGMQDWFDCIVVVAAREETQLRRLKQRDGMGVESARARMQAQWPLAAKVEKAQHIIWNDGSLDDLREQVRTLFESLGCVARAL